MRKRARSYAQPQIHAARRQGHQEVRALGSEGRRLQQVIHGAAHDFRHIPGLSGRDLRIALENVAQQRIDTAGGIASQQSAVRADTRGTVSDILQQATSDLVQQDAANQQAVRMAKLGGRIDLRNARATSAMDLANALKTARVGAKLDLRSAAVQAALDAAGQKGSGGLTPLQQHEANQKRQGALAIVRAQIAAQHTSKKPFPQSKAQWQAWGDAIWQANRTAVDRGDIQWAINHVQRQHSRHNVQGILGILQGIVHAAGG